MKKLFLTAEQLSKDAEAILANLLVYNPGVRSLCRKIPLQTIQYDIASLMREYA